MEHRGEALQDFHFLRICSICCVETACIVVLEVAKTHVMVLVVVHSQSVAEAVEHPEKEHAVVTHERPDGRGGELLGVDIYGMVHGVLVVGSSHFRSPHDQGKDTVRQVHAEHTAEFEDDDREDNNSAEDVDIDCLVTEDSEGGDGGGEQGVNEQVGAHGYDMAMVDTENGGRRRMDLNGSSLATENSTDCFPNLPHSRSILWDQICSSNGQE